VVKISISLILPTYNEKENIKKLIDLSIKSFEKSKIDYEIIVVDDNSPDGTSKKVLELKKKKKYSNVRLIVRKEKGLATAIRKGFDEAKMDHVMAIDTDLSHHPKYFPCLFKYHKKYDVVLASRFLSSKSKMKAPFYRIIASKIVNLIIKLLLWINLTDITGGFLIIDKTKLDKLPKDYIFRGYGDYCIRLLYLANKRKYSIKEISYIYNFRAAGTTKTSFLKEVTRYFLTIIKIRFKFLFF
jgi:dolichol-phosphate mannosyltransferase